MSVLATWWAERAPRERRVLAGGAAVLAALLAWAYGWHPLQAERARLAADLPRLRAEAAAVAASAADVSRLRASRTAGGEPGEVIRTRLQSHATGGGVSVTAQPDQRYRVVLPPMRFDVLTRELGVLAEAHGIVIERLALTAQPAPGVVGTDVLVLRAPRLP
jgi:general secretion pathway protein M